MAGRRGAQASGYANTLILRGENPQFGEDEDEFGGGGFGGGMDEPDGDEFPGEEEMAYKGRSVNGPRTKLSASLDARLSNMDLGLAQLAKSVNLMGRYMQAQTRKGRISKHDDMMGGGGADPMGDPMGGGYEEDEDPMAIPGAEEDENLDLAAGPQLRASGEGTNLNVRKAQVAKAQRVLAMNKAFEKQQLKKAARALQAAGYSIVSKDDAATSFGEKDSDVTGNRGLDTESVGEDDTVIQGGPGAGPGPVSKAMQGGATPINLEATIQKSVVSTMGAMLESYGLRPVAPLQLPAATQGSAVMKATAPAPGASGFESKLDNASGEPDLGELFDRMRKEPFGKINNIRVQVGDLSGGIL